MAHIKIKKGLDIPIGGKPQGSPKDIQLGGEPSPQQTPRKIALNLDPFEEIRFKLLAKTGDRVKIGQPLVEDKATPGRVWCAPAAGIISEVRRGLKRRLLNVVIDLEDQEDFYNHNSLDVHKASKKELIEKFLNGGIFARIRSRPFNLLANPEETPKSIFVKGIESAPFVPPQEMQVEGFEEAFATGLEALRKLTDGDVHLVYHKECTFTPFTKAKGVKHHTAEGPHPIGNFSMHIHEIDPILSIEECVWTLTALDVVSAGHLLKTGHVHTARIISIAGPGIFRERVGYYKAREGYPIEALISNRLKKGLMRLISGDPLNGQKVEASDFLGFYHTAFCVIPENVERELLHFFRLGSDKFSHSRAYLSGHLNNEAKEYPFTTSLHGEERAFIEPSLYDDVMPLSIPTMQLVKAVMAEDFDLAEELGLLEIDSEDFALPTFVCPSKIEMTEIIKQGLKAHAAEVLE